MKEKNKLLTFFLIIAVIVIIIMGYFVYNMYNEKVKAEVKADNLNEQLTDLQNTTNTLQQKMDVLSNTINEEVNSSDYSVNGTQNNISTGKSTNNLNLGNYTVNETSVSELDGRSNSECGITLKENNEFYFYMGWGTGLSGTYEIKDNLLVCNANERKDELEDGKYNRKTSVVLNFEIVNDNKLKLTDIKINDTNTDKLIYSDGLAKGMTYSKK